MQLHCCRLDAAEIYKDFVHLMKIIVYIRCHRRVSVEKVELLMEAVKK